MPRPHRLMPFAVLMIALFPLHTASAQTILYVDANATGPTHDGSTWCFAFTELYEALAVATEGTTIRVAEGTYTPDADSVSDARYATFSMISGVRLEGGYAGCGAVDPDDRNIAAYQTILSGDLDGDDDPGDFPNGPSFDDNSYHVVTGSGTDATAVLDGFTVIGGNASSWGGGMYNNDGSPTVMNCTFNGNSAGSGGGMSSSGYPALTNCTFSGNSADYGGGIFCFDDPTLTNCTFIGNSATDGGGVYNYYDSPTLTGCTFSSNLATHGGGVYNDAGNAALTDCTFSGNSASNYGGGMYNDGDPTVTQCTFSDNSASNYGGGMYSSGSPTVTDCTFSGNSANGSRARGGGMFSYEGSPSLANCTFSDNSAYEGGGTYNDEGSPTLTGCTFSGNSATWGGGMFNDWGSPTVMNCTFRSNSAAWGGGGVYSYQGSPTLTNCTFSGNTANGIETMGGGMYNDFASLTLTNCTFSGNSAYYGGGLYRYSGSPTLANCILWGNTRAGGVRDQSAQISSMSGVTYSCIEGWEGYGTGNTRRDPRFVDPDGADDIVGTSDDDLRVLPFSPVIDTGKNDAVPPDSLDLDGDGDTSEPTPLDLAGSPRFMDDPLVDDQGIGMSPIIDMGAFESADCDGNLLPDWEDIAEGRSADCNENETPDQCEVLSDCNGNMTPDDCDIAEGYSLDCNANNTPDECDISDGTSADCDDNTVPDECDIAEGTSSDCNDNAIPDECDIMDGASGDCNDNSIPDECDMAHGTSPDCNDNTIPDECDIATGGSVDCDTNGVPDECETDTDVDGVIDGCDACPETPHGLLVGDDGCVVPFGPCCFAAGTCIDDTEAADCSAVDGSYLGNGLTCDGDPDHDFSYGCDDGCPFDPNKTEQGVCGCGVPEDDTDGDTLQDCVDLCPDTPVGDPVNGCGCSVFGACCFAAGVCWDDVEPADCVSIGGVYQGDGSICDEDCGFGDSDLDGDVDLADVAQFLGCFGRVIVAGNCSWADADRCGSIELADFEGVRTALTGPR